MLAPGQTDEVVFVVGQAEGLEQVRRLVSAYTAPGRAREVLADVQRLWDRILGVVQVVTPDPGLDLMVNRSQELSDLVIDTGNQLAETISSRVEEVNTTLKNTGDSLVLDLSLRGGDVVSKLEQTGTRISETIVQRGNRVTDQFHESAEVAR